MIANKYIGKKFITKYNEEVEIIKYIDSKNVIVANYSGGNIAVFGKEKNGGLTKVKQIVQHSGKGSNKQRQESPHVHMVYFSPDKKYVILVGNKGKIGKVTL